MAITTLAELKTAFQSWRGRSDADFVSACDDFVTLFESRANDELPIRTSEVNSDLTGTLDSRSISLPGDFLEPVALFLTTFGIREKLAFIIPGNYALGTSSGVPSAWMVNGANIDLDVPCDQAHTFILRYRMKLLDLSTTDPNWLLTNHPDVYLYGGLREAAIWARDVGAASQYEALYEQAKNRVQWVEARSKSRAPLRVDPALATVGAYNINSDGYNGVG